MQAAQVSSSRTLARNAVFRPARSACTSRRNTVCRAVLKLHYFDLPGRAETARLILEYGKVQYEDVRFPREAWAEFKAKTPMGQVPVLEVDGQLLAQSSAIDRYVASLAGLLPSDPLKALQAEQWYFLPNDITQLFISTWKAEDRVAARKPIVEGPFTDKLNYLEKHMEGKKYILGDEICYVDLAMFVSLSFWASGFIEGIPTDYINNFPNLKAYRNRIATLDSIQKMYADKTAPQYAPYKPDA